MFPNYCRDLSKETFFRKPDALNSQESYLKQRISSSFKVVNMIELDSVILF